MRSSRSGLPVGSAVLLDSNPVIYWLEDGPLFTGFAAVFEDLIEGRLEGFVTPVTLAEVVGGPWRAGDAATAEKYRSHMLEDLGWTMVDLDAATAMLAARLRAEHRLKLLDALQAAVTLREGCAAIVTHDRDFSAVTGLEVIDGRQGSSSTAVEDE